ncbi:hypothetical protein [Mycoplasmopsis glycophila]|uniref:Maltose-binding periplasmic proteins/domains n=1 Tax=Mycoplasmopsis glycophila TaxID=171285 RepID=A0A449AWR1_9BACT|nr:hypothetical protein [Mycoplasmopsis glycophila]VEU71138.1 Maltose-binding periplasmic proteins/domains [Mycoplasmopsis glycophila]
MKKNKKLWTSMVLSLTTLTGFSIFSAGCNPETTTKDDSNVSGGIEFNLNRDFRDKDGLIKDYTNEDISSVYATSSTPASKVLLVNVDGSQKTMYHNAFYLFKQTQAYAKGYRIKTIEKGAFDILDTTINVGATDERQAPDILYAPSDRVTDLASRGMVVELDKFDPKLLDTLQKSINLTDTEKNDILAYGSYLGLKQGETTPSKKFLAIRHNVEGIVLASNKEEVEVRADLLSNENNTLLKMVQNGKGLFFYQNFWFGNGLLGGYFTNRDHLTEAQKNDSEYSVDNLMNKSIYQNIEKGAPSSGWVVTDPFHEVFAPVINLAGAMSYEIWNAIYKMTDEEYANSPWGQKGIQRKSLEVALSSDGGNFNNQVYAFFKENKLNYTILGSWELTNAFKNGGVKSVFAAPDVDEGVPYLQSPGSWTYLINVRNLNAEKYGNLDDRKQALRELLLAIYSPEASNAYFKADTKIPYAKSLQNLLKANVDQTLENENEGAQTFARDLGYANVSELKAKYAELVAPVDALAGAFIGNGWENTADANATSENNKTATTEEFVVRVSSLPEESVVRFKELLQPYGLPLKNALAGLYQTSVAGLTAGTEAYKLSTDLLSEDAKTNSRYDELKDGKNWHLRKVEKAIFGVNEDNEKDSFIDQIKEYTIKLLKATTAEEKAAAQGEYDAFYNNLLEAGYAFYAPTAKNPVDKATFSDLFAKRMTYWFNNALLRSLGTTLLDALNFPRKDGSASDVKYSKVAQVINDLLKAGIVNKVFDVLTSTTPYDQGGLGVFRTLQKRPGVSNPQFGIVWETWNEKTFGALPVFTELRDKGNITDKESFLNAIRTKLSDNMKTKLGAIQGDAKFLIPWT